MIILYIAKTELGEEKLREWEKNNKEYSIYKEKPFTITETFKDSAVEYMLKQTAKRLRVPISLIKENMMYKDSISSKLKIQASKTLGIDKSNIEVKID